MKKKDEELQKIDLRMSELQQRINTILGYEGPPELDLPFIDKPPPEVKDLVAERADLETERRALEIRRAELVAEGEEEARLADEHNRTQTQDCP